MPVQDRRRVMRGQRVLSESPTRTLASVLYVLAAAAFVVSGAGLVVRQEWSRVVLAASAVFSSAVIVLYWDGHLDMVVEKGVVGLLINVAALAALALIARPAAAY